MEKKTDKSGRDFYELDNGICSILVRPQEAIKAFPEPCITLEVIDPAESATYDMSREDARTLAAMLLRFADTGTVEP